MIKDLSGSAVFSGVLADTKPARIAEYRKRRRSYDEKRIAGVDRDEYEISGWTLAKETKRGLRMRRNKTADEILENQFWCLLYALGYDDFNIGRRFYINVEDSGKTFTRQIDIFAKDDETIIVAECKTADKIKDKRLQREIGDFDSLKRPIANALRSYYGQDLKQKIIWCFVTSRIRWHESDIARAKEAKISIITDRELRYYTEIATSLGRSARYQFHAEFLSGQKIPALHQERVPAIRQKIKGRIAYFFTIRASDLLARAFVNHRDLRDPSGAPTYQRLIDGKRVKKIADYLSGGGFYANSILVNFREQRAFERSGSGSDGDVQFGQLVLPETYKSCWIIDGQHRLYGAGHLDKNDLDTMLPVIAFETLTKAEEANLFTVINREQKSVQKRLLVELDGELKWGSDDHRESMSAICSRSMDILNNEVAGPFEDRMVPSSGKGVKHQTITLPEVRSAILTSGLIGRVAGRDGTFIPGPLCGKTNEDTLHNLCDLLTDYFAKIRDINLDRWNDGRKGYLCNNFGITGHIRMLGELIPYVCRKEGIDPHELETKEIISTIWDELVPIFNFIRDASEDDFKKQFFVAFGSGGAPQYFYKLVALIHRHHPEFVPKGYEDFMRNTDDDRRTRADAQVKTITAKVHSHVVARLKEIYGESFFERGVKSKDIKLSAYAKQMEADEGKPIETYLDFIELKKIVESTENWPHFKEVFNIPMDGQQKGLAKYVLWFEEFNKIRRIPAHSYGRAYTDQDIRILEEIDRHLSDLK